MYGFWGHQSIGGVPQLRLRLSSIAGMTLIDRSSGIRKSFWWSPLVGARAVGMGGIPITRPPLDEAIEIVNHALDLGVNFIDTAIGYSTSERRIGEAIEDRREDVILTTKAWGNTKELAEEQLETSLRRLRTDYLDLWQFHGINSFEEYDEIMSLRARFCRQCEYCGPCPNSVIIHGLMYLQHLYELWPPERFFTWKYVLDSVESGRNCTECGLCEPKCPYNLPIRAMIKEKLAYYEEKKLEHADLIASLNQ